MNETFTSQLKIVECSQEYWEFVRLLRMNKDVEAGFVKQGHISEEDQIAYMKKHANSYRICLHENTPCGYIGVVDNDLRICVSPEYWRKGIGSFMILKTRYLWPNPQVKIKASNNKSINLFKKNGFAEKYLIMEPKDLSDA